MKDIKPKKIVYKKSNKNEISNKSKMGLNEKELAKLDKVYNGAYPEHVQNSMFDYSVDSDMVNDCLRNHDGVWNLELKKKYGINRTQFNNMVKDLDNNQVKLVENTILL